MLEVCLCKPAIYKLKILDGDGVGVGGGVGGGGGLNTKKRGVQIFKVQWGEEKGGDYDFWLKFSGGGEPWRKLCGYQI